MVWLLASLPLLLLARAAQQQQLVGALHSYDITPPYLLPPPADLKVEGLVPPNAVLSTTTPTFSFAHGDTAALQKILPRGAAQSAYRITVSTIVGTNASLLWDSGTIASQQCSQIEYAGPMLMPFGRYNWSAEWQATGGHRSARAFSTFETGPMSMDDWHGASWLSGGTQLRIQFEVMSENVARARAYVAAPGCHALLVNGGTPQPDLRGVCPWVAGASHNKHPDYAHDRTNVRYMSHDVTSLLNSTGTTNVLGLLSGHVMIVANHSGADVDKTKDPEIGNPLVMGLLMVEFSDGRQPQFLPTTANAGWTSAVRPFVTVSHAWATSIDWTKYDPSWATVHDRSPPRAWGPVKTMPSVNVPRALGMPRSTVLATHSPVSVRTLPGGKHWLYTFARQIVGTIRVKALPDAHTGSRLTIRAGEWLDDDTYKGDSHLPPCNASAQPCRSHPGVTYCPTDKASGQCDKPMPHKPCPPCPPSPPMPIPRVNLGNRSIPTIAGDQQQYENHTLRFDYERDIETLFCWHGFQYVLVADESAGTSFTGEIGAIEALEIRTNISETGSLWFGGDSGNNSSSLQAARIFRGVDRITRNSHLANVAAYMPTDCPTREKHGWLGDALDASDEGMYNFDMHSVLRAYLQVIEDSQYPNGDLPAAVPNPGDSRYDTVTKNATQPCGDIAWGAAFPGIAMRLHLFYGDVHTVSRHWASMVRYVEHLVTVATRQSCAAYDHHGNQNKSCRPTAWNSLAVCDQFGKPHWSTCPVPEVMAGYSYIQILRAMAKLAPLVQPPLPLGVAARYESLASDAMNAFHGTFWNQRLNAYGGDSGAVQSLNIPGLDLGAAVSHGVDTQVLQRLQHNLENETNYHLRVGAVVSKILLTTLSEYGMHTAALKVATQEDEPSWGYWLSQNASSCWEAWPGATDGSTSRNHIFLCGGKKQKRIIFHAHIITFNRFVHDSIASLLDQEWVAIVCHGPFDLLRCTLGFGEWLWKSIVGLRPTAPAFMNVSVAPMVGFADGPASVSSRLQTARGVIMVAWNISLARDRIQLTVSLPIGVQYAVVTIPAPFQANGTRATPQECIVLESGRVLWKRVAASLDTWSTGILSVGLGNATIQTSASPSVVQVAVVGNGQFDFETSLLPR